VQAGIGWPWLFGWLVGWLVVLRDFDFANEFLLISHQRILASVKLNQIRNSFCTSNMAAVGAIASGVGLLSSASSAPIVHRLGAGWPSHRRHHSQWHLVIQRHECVGFDCETLFCNQTKAQHQKKQTKRILSDLGVKAESITLEQKFSKQIYAGLYVDLIRCPKSLSSVCPTRG
jgi:hypothetical protein